MRSVKQPNIECRSFQKSTRFAFRNANRQQRTGNVRILSVCLTRVNGSMQALNERMQVPKGFNTGYKAKDDKKSREIF
jgi:hypothetical protein